MMVIMSYKESQTEQTNKQKNRSRSRARYIYISLYCICTLHPHPRKHQEIIIFQITNLRIPDLFGLMSDMNWGPQQGTLLNLLRATWKNAQASANGSLEVQQAVNFTMKKPKDVDTNTQKTYIYIYKYMLICILWQVLIIYARPSGIPNGCQM